MLDLKYGLFVFFFFDSFTIDTICHSLLRIAQSRIFEFFLKVASILQRNFTQIRFDRYFNILKHETKGNRFSTKHSQHNSILPQPLHYRSQYEAKFSFSSITTLTFRSLRIKITIDPTHITQHSGIIYVLLLHTTFHLDFPTTNHIFHGP